MNQEERSERSRAQILEAALKLFSHRGYGATSVRDIAESAGVSKGNVYHHFSDKETIFRALLDQYFQAMSTPDFPFKPALHVNYQETRLPMQDGLPKLKDIPQEMGGTGEPA